MKTPTSRKQGDSQQAAKRTAYRGKLVAITATGPIHLSKLVFEVAPVNVGLTFIQELALRADDPRAEVVATRARAVKGDAALAEWGRTCGLMSGWLLRRTPSQRVQFLNEVVSYVGRRKNASGIEPILGAALNAAWPWIEEEAFARIVTRMSAYMRASEFAAARSVPILDINTRTLTFFAPGELAKIDVNEWLDWRAIARGASRASGQNVSNRRPGADAGFGADILGKLFGQGTPGGFGLDLSGLPGQGGQDSFGADILGKLLGPRGPDLSGLGPDGMRGNGGDTFGADILGRLLGPRGPDLSGIGPDGARRGDSFGADILGKLLPTGMLGGHGLDLSNVRGNGGPYGYGSALAPGGAGAASWVLAGVAFAIVVGVVVGLSYLAANKDKDRVPAPDKPPPPETPLPPIGSDRPQPPPPDDPPPSPKNDKDPKDGGPNHLYPDPDGGGGIGPTRLPDKDEGGNPTTIWDEFGGGGNPATLWDENEGGVNPTTIWDENGGGGNPTTTAEKVSAIGLTGRGLLASVIQVGPRTFAF